MFKEENFSQENELNQLSKLYKKIITKEENLEKVDLIKRFFLPLRATINQGRFDFKLVEAWNSATNLLDLKMQDLLDKALQRGGVKDQNTPISGINTISNALHLIRPIQPLERKISQKNVIKAYIELMIHRRKKRTYSLEPERMGYEPITIEPISIEINKEKLLHKIRGLKKSVIDFKTLLVEKTWKEVLELLNILLHLAHEEKIKLHQENFPNGKIIITYQEGKN
ncbi:MAG: hypothetical protein ACTSQI_11840 [Candidatus Helarchaeota archaeon]